MGIVVRHPRAEQRSVATVGAGQAFVAIMREVRFNSVELLRRDGDWFSVVNLVPGEPARDPAAFRDVGLGGVVALHLLEGKGGWWAPAYRAELLVALFGVLSPERVARHRDAINLRFEALFQGRSLGDAEDESARAELLGLSEGDGFALFAACEKLLAEVGEWVDYGWPSIEAIAAGLVRDRCLTEREVVAILREVPGSPLGRWGERQTQARLAMRLAMGIRDLVWDLQGQSPCVQVSDEDEYIQEMLRCHPIRRQ